MARLEYPTLAELIRERRKTAEKSLCDVARHVPMTKQHLHDLEKERSRNPSIHILFGLSRELDLDPLELIEACFRTVRKENCSPAPPVDGATSSKTQSQQEKS